MIRRKSGLVVGAAVGVGAGAGGRGLETERVDL